MRFVKMLSLFVEFAAWSWCAGYQCNSNATIDDSKLCDGNPDCADCGDETSCLNTRFFPCGDACVTLPTVTCQSGVTCNSFCDGTKDCHDGSDERRIGFGFKCVVQAFKVRVHAVNRCILPQFYITRWNGLKQPNETICSGGEDKECYVLLDGNVYFDFRKCWTCGDGSVIHRQQVCDGVLDCADFTDECLCEENSGVHDFCNGLLSSHTKCRGNEVICANSTKCIDRSAVCDGINDCTDGTDERHCQNEARINSSFVCNRNVGEMPAVPCDMRPDCAFLEDECNNNCNETAKYCQYFSPIDNNVRFNACSVPSEAVCDGVPNCANREDENYCPFKVPCDPNNVTMGLYDADYETCDFNRNCANGIDEQGCHSSHFYCDNNNTFLRKSQVLDGVFDCNDFSDECPANARSISSVHRMIKELPLQISMWAIMILAFVGNLVVITRTSHELWIMLRRSSSNPNKIKLSHKIMVLNLSVGDILMAFYLCIVVAKSVEFSGNYCRHKLEWLSSPVCSLAGVLAMLSSQSTVLIMSLMTTYRLYGVLRPFRNETTSIKTLIGILILLWSVALILAILPLSPALQSTFVSGYVINQPYIKTSNISLKQMRGLVDRLNILSNSNYVINPNQPGESFRKIFIKGEIPPSDSGVKMLGFYSSNSVCLPNLYTKENEASSNFTISVILIDLLLFVYLFVGYVVIYRATMTNGRARRWRSTETDVRSREDRAMWIRIASLILTDFVCWVPICLMSLLSFGGVELPDVVYPFTATILFPINSAFNPWLYSTDLFLLERCSKNKEVDISRLSPKTYSSRPSHMQRSPRPTRSKIGEIPLQSISASPRTNRTYRKNKQRTNLYTKNTQILSFFRPKYRRQLSSGSISGNSNTQSADTIINATEV